MRRCVSCLVEKPEEAFRLRKSVATGKHYRGRKCRQCHQQKSMEWRHNNKEKWRGYNKKQREKPGAREKNNTKALRSHFVRKFGITIEERDAILASQGGACMICGTTEPKGKGWCVDHDHRTNKIRAILCAPCNLVIGHAQENPNTLRAAADYLEVHQ